MALDRLQVKVAETVCGHYTNSRRPATRKELVLLVRDGFVLEEMANHTLIRTDANRAQYFPTLGTFALLDDTDERLIAAHEATVRILRILLRLYETRDAHVRRAYRRGSTPRRHGRSAAGSIGAVSLHYRVRRNLGLEAIGRWPGYRVRYHSGVSVENNGSRSSLVATGRSFA